MRSIRGNGTIRWLQEASTLRHLVVHWRIGREIRSPELRRTLEAGLRQALVNGAPEHQYYDRLEAAF